MRMSTMTVSLIVLICTVLFGGLMVSRSYFEGFKMDPNANNPPVQYIAPQGQAMMAPQGQAMMAPQGQAMMAPNSYDPNAYAGQAMMMDPQGNPMMMAPQENPMKMAPQGQPLMPPMALPIDAQIMLPIQSPVFARTRVNNQPMGAPYQPAQPMQNPGEQVGPTKVM